MKETDIDAIINMNYRLQMLLGIATSIIIDYQRLNTSHDDVDKCAWFIRQVENVIYLDKPLESLKKE